MGGITLDWIEIFVETTREGLEPISGVLYQCGLTGLMIEDEVDFQEFLENPNRDWDYIEEGLVTEKTKKPTGITFFVRDNIHGREQLAQIKGSLLTAQSKEKELNLGSLEITVKNIKEEDWANNWKKYFKPLPVGNKLIIRPSWEVLDDPMGRKVLKIDPGHIFGTGTHETTQLCLELLETYVTEGDKVLDIGCGSGILSIASLLLGAEKAEAVDIDANAVEIAYENASMNEIGKDRYHVLAGNILSDESLQKAYSGNKYEIVVANIVADIIIGLSGQVPDYIKNGGIFIASGIILERLEEVKEALKNQGFILLDTLTKKDWAAIALRYQA